MNTMITLALQLLLYSVTWLVLGWVFGVRRKAGFWWSAAFAALAVGCWTAGQPNWQTSTGAVALLNLGLIGGFYCLMRGLAYMGRYPVSMLETITPLAMLAAILLLRLAAPDLVAVRLLLFSLCVGWCVVRSAWLIKQLLADVGYPGLFLPLGLAPVLILLALLGVRPFAVALDAGGTAAYLLATDSGYKDLLVLAGFLCLMLFNLAMAVVVIGGLVQRLRDISTTDVLTQLPNRRAVLDAVTHEHDRYRRSGRPYSVLVIDVDFFKRVNDTHGHAAGDQVLIGVAHTMRTCARDTDMVARFGGEEFLVFLPDTSEEQAFTMGERMRGAVSAGQHSELAPQLVVTISAGLATVAPDDATVDEVIARADRALYQAKHQGRNQVVRPSATTDSLWSESLANQPSHPTSH
ncbi:MAG TPA: GGDEF domain-containing protein [Burkholderiaceae bacterium]|mgnify:CR=1 FL=1|nr:GGDEF domain-containing protein [Burkholderiaceae bacterium]